MGTCFTGICKVPAPCVFTGFYLKTDRNPKTGLIKTKQQSAVEHYATGIRSIKPSVALQKIKAGF